MLPMFLGALGQAPVPVIVPAPATIAIAQQTPRVVIVPALEPPRIVWLDRPFAAAAAVIPAPVVVRQPSALSRARVALADRWARLARRWRR